MVHKSASEDERELDFERRVAPDSRGEAGFRGFRFRGFGFRGKQQHEILRLLHLGFLNACPNPRRSILQDTGGNEGFRGCHFYDVGLQGVGF